MKMQNNPYLNAASQAIQDGELEKARDILIPLVEQDPNNAEAWFLLSGALDEPRAIMACLRNILVLMPHHVGAIKMMTQLEQQTGLQPLQVMQVGAGSAASEQFCPYCSDSFKATEEVVVCPKCQSNHHFECWLENSHSCAAVLCDGFSIRELYQDPLPLQPPTSEAKTIVIKKEDIPDGTTVTRKQQEERFQRRLLLMALMAEEGQLPPGAGDNLPGVDELLDQIQRDRVVDKQTISPAEPPGSEAASPPSTPAPASPPFQPTPESYRSSGVVTDVISIWPDQAQPEAPPATGPAKSCQNCGYDLQNSTARFCPKCGTER